MNADLLINPAQTAQRQTYTVAQFASLFGKEKTWAYRLLYAGKVQAITGYGETMIPHSEYERLLNDKQRYLGRRSKVRVKEAGA